MPDFRNFESLENILAAHEATIEREEERQRLLAAVAGQQLLTKIVKPCLGSRKPKYFHSSLNIRHVKRQTYQVEGDLPLEPVVVGDQPATARLVLSGTYRTLAKRQQKGQIREDPLSCLVPQSADLTLVIADLERPYLVTAQHWASFDQQQADGLGTGFYDPQTLEPLAYDGNYYAGVVETLREAERIQTTACGV